MRFFGSASEDDAHRERREGAASSLRRRHGAAPELPLGVATNAGVARPRFFWGGVGALFWPGFIREAKRTTFWPFQGVRVLETRHNLVPLLDVSCQVKWLATWVVGGHEPPPSLDVHQRAPNYKTHPHLFLTFAAAEE